MTNQFSPSSWSEGARAVDTTARDFAGQAHATLAQLANVADVVGMPATQADGAVAQILHAVAAAAARTVAGISTGLAMEADTMAVTGRDYEQCEANNESIARRIGA